VLNQAYTSHTIIFVASETFSLLPFHQYFILIKNQQIPALLYTSIGISICNNVHHHRFDFAKSFVKPKLLLSPRSHQLNNMASAPSAPGDFDNLNDTAMFQIRSSVEFYFKSIHENMPAFYLPKEIVDSMGPGRLARVAHNYAYVLRLNLTIIS
jgi:hypothetical protein